MSDDLNLTATLTEYNRNSSGPRKRFNRLENPQPTWKPKFINGMPEAVYYFLQESRERAAARSAAASAAWQAMYDACTNSGQRAVLEHLKSEYFLMHSDGNYFGNDEALLYFAGYMKHWANRVNAITGGNGLPNVPDIAPMGAGDDADSQDAEEAGEDGGESEEFFEYESDMGE